MKKYIPNTLYNENKIIRNAMGKDEKLIDQVLDIAGDGQKLIQNSIFENVDRLKRDNIFDLQKSKSNLSAISQSFGIADDIYNNYGGDFLAWAKNYTKEQTEQEIFKNAPQGTDLSIVRQPDAAYSDTLNDRAEELARKTRELFKNLEDLGVPYKDIEEGKKYLEQNYDNVFANLKSDNKFNILKELGSFLKGNGFNVVNEKELAEQYANSVFKAKIADIQKINDDFKVLYAMSPALAAQYENVVKNYDWHMMGTPTVSLEDLGNGTSLVTSEYVYMNKNGKKEVVREQYLEADQNKIKAFNKGSKSVENRQLYQKLLTDEGNIEFNRLLQNPNLNIQEAYDLVDSDFKINANEIEANDAFRNAFASGAISRAREANNLKFFTQETNPLNPEKPILRPNEALQVYIDSGYNIDLKPEGYYEDDYVFAKEKIFPNLSLKEIAGIVDVDAAAISEEKTVQALKVNIFGGASLPNGEFIVDEQKIEDLEFDLKFQNPVNGLEKNGDYYNPKNPIIGSPQDILSQFPSLADAFRADSSIFRNEKIEVGYNINEEKIVFRGVQGKPTTSENDVTSDGLIAQYLDFDGFALEDIPVLNVAAPALEPFFGERIGDDLKDVGIVIPGFGVYKLGSFLIRKGGSMLGSILQGIARTIGTQSATKKKIIDYINKNTKTGKFSAKTQLEIRKQAKKAYDIVVENSLKALKTRLQRQGFKGQQLKEKLRRSKEAAYKAVDKWYKGNGKIPDEYINGDLGFGAGEFLLGKTAEGTVVRLFGLGSVLSESAREDEQIEDLDLGE